MKVTINFQGRVGINDIPQSVIFTGTVFQRGPGGDTYHRPWGNDVSIYYRSGNKIFRILQTDGKFHGGNTVGDAYVDGYRPIEEITIT